MSAVKLPIYELEPAIVEALPHCARMVIEAPTGSGKSTQVPQMLLDHDLVGGRQIVVMQPRRIAARMLARRVAAERGATLGREVGYQVRLDDCSGPDTRIKFETEGVILRQLLTDPELRGVGAIVFDEFHERHLYADVMLGLALRLQRTRRPDLKLIVMSATLDGAPIEALLAPCTALRSEGRTHPVSMEYLSRALHPERDRVWAAAAREFERLARRHPDGDVLVFMPGAYEIRRTVDAIRQSSAGRGIQVLPLHGELSPKEQDAAMEPCRERKVVVATNVAETSLTIEGIGLVIDSGLARKARFDAQRGINTLLIEKISRASAEQRAGRAGRTRAGHCLRLWTEQEQGQRVERDAPEIRRVDLAEVILTLKAAGVDALDELPMLDLPDQEQLERAFGLLTDLGALTASGHGLTDMGRRLLRFPVHPRYGRMLIAADHYGCVASVALVAALSQERSILLGRQNRDVLERRERVVGEEARSDLLALLKAWRYAESQGFDPDACGAIGVHGQAARRAEALRNQFLDIARRLRLDTRERDVPSEAIEKCILAGFSDQVGCRASPGNARCRLVHGRRGTLDKASVVKEGSLLVATEIHEIGRARGDVEVRLSQATAVEAAWLHELFPEDMGAGRTVAYDAVLKRVTRSEQVLFRDLVIEQKSGMAPSPDEAARALAEKVLDGTLTLKSWDHAVEQWLARVNLMAAACPEMGIAAFGDEDRRDVVQQVCLGATGYKAIKERPVMPIVRGWLSAAQQDALDKLAPERLSLSNGRKPKVRYESGKPPVIALRIQELYGVDCALTIAMGRVRVLVHVLAPNQRPVQITDDLASFWANTYPQVKKELRGRYPKHEWR